MECCILVFVIIIIAVVLVFGTMILGIVAAILSVIYLLLLDFINWIKRIVWSKTLIDLSYEELKKILGESEISLRFLKSDDRKFSAGLGIKGREIEDFYMRLRIDANTAKINNIQARIVILKRLLNEQQPLEDARLTEQHARRQEELKGLTLTMEYKLVEQFVKKNLDDKNKDDLPKLQLLLETKGWKITSDELQNLVSVENQKQHLENARLKILTDNPESRKEILKSYLHYYQPFDIELIALEQILEENNLSYDDTATLQSELRNLDSEVETEQFEKSLLDESK